MAQREEYEMHQPVQTADMELVRGTGIGPALARSAISLTPAWAAISGAMASDARAGGRDILILLAAIAFLELAYYLAFSAVGWRPYVTMPVNARPREAGVRWLPYSRENSPSGFLLRLGRAALERLRWGVHAVSAGCPLGRAVAFITAGGLLLVLGWPAVWAALALGALATIVYLLGTDRTIPGSVINGIAAVFIPWSLVGNLMGGVGLLAIGCMLAFSLCRAAVMGNGQLHGGRRASVLVGLSGLGVVLIMVFLKEPFIAAILALLFLALVFLRLGTPFTFEESGLRRSQPLIAIAIVTAGLGLKLGGAA